PCSAGGGAGRRRVGGWSRAAPWRARRLPCSPDRRPTRRQPPAPPGEGGGRRAGSREHAGAALAEVGMARVLAEGADVPAAWTLLARRALDTHSQPGHERALGRAVGAAERHLGDQ